MSFRRLTTWFAMILFHCKNAFIWFEFLNSSSVLVKAAFCISKEKDFYLSVREKKFTNNHTEGY